MSNPKKETRTNSNKDKISSGVIEKQTRNVLRKSKSGKNLSDKEKSIVADQEEKESSSKRRKPRVADSIKSAASILGYDISILEAAKRKGCPAFRSSRVHLDELTEWLESNKKSLDEIHTKVDLELEKLRIDCRTREFNYQRLIGNYTQNDLIEETIASMTSELISLLTRYFVNDAPPILEGLNALQISEKCAQFLEEIKGSIYSKLKADE